MKNKINPLVSLLLAILMLIGALPVGAVAFTGRAVDYRGSMSEDENGVLVYNELADYRVKSAKNTVLKLRSCCLQLRICATGNATSM